MNRFHNENLIRRDEMVPATNSEAMLERKEYLERVILMAQADYDRRLINSCEHEIAAIDRYLRGLPAISPENLRTGMNIFRQRLVSPFLKSDEEFAKEWQETPYEGKSFEFETSEHYTDKGERVRSKSEIAIANALAKRGIPYKYECPVILPGYGRVYLDFTILNVKERKEIYLEHFGIMDDEEYVNGFMKKMNSLPKVGIVLGKNLFITVESSRYPLSISTLNALIDSIFER